MSQFNTLYLTMAGHSQFKNIMHRKGAQDAKRARKFAKLTREIIVAAKSGIPEADKNPRLRAALAAARAENMPKDNIERALKKATGDSDQSNYEAIRYEGYGVGGVAVIVETLTDNRNRSAPEMRAIFSKHGGQLAETGSVAFGFDHVGLLHFPKNKPFDAVFEMSVEAGADDVEEYDDRFEIMTKMEAFGPTRDALLDSLGDPMEAKLVWMPRLEVDVSEEQRITLEKMMDALEYNDDVQDVFCNMRME
jgi:YebC/PmpR family DNA-binding regulatory protein